MITALVVLIAIVVGLLWIASVLVAIQIYKRFTRLSEPIPIDTKRYRIGNYGQVYMIVDRITGKVIQVIE